MKTTTMLLTQEIIDKLAENGLQAVADRNFDPTPVCQLFTPDANATWLLFWSYPGKPDRVRAIVDLGVGFAELGDISIREIKEVRGGLGLPVERDLYFSTSKTLTEILDASRRVGRIVV